MSCVVREISTALQTALAYVELDLRGLVMAYARSAQREAIREKTVPMPARAVFTESIRLQMQQRVLRHAKTVLWAHIWRQLVIMLRQTLSCAEGTYSSLEGATDASTCAECIKGTFSNLARSACTPCPAGYSSRDGSSKVTDSTAVELQRLKGF